MIFHIYLKKGLNIALILILQIIYLLQPRIYFILLFTAFLLSYLPPIFFCSHLFCFRLLLQIIISYLFPAGFIQFEVPGSFF